MQFNIVTTTWHLLTCWFEAMVCMTTILIPPVTILSGFVVLNSVFWMILLHQSMGFQVQKIKVMFQYVACWYWKIFSFILHGHEVFGRENIPDTGPALILYYHGAVPVDYIYLVADTFIQKKRVLHSVIDKFLSKLPGVGSLLQVFHCEASSRESCAAVLQAGHLLGISPGGMYEAQLGDNMYQVMWKARDGFAQVVKEAGDSIPIIPVFTQNIREAYKSFNFGLTRPVWAWLYQVTRKPLVPVYGSFPVKLRTYIGSAIVLPSTASIEEIRSSSLAALEALIATHQKTPGNTWRALTERVI